MVEEDMQQVHLNGLGLSTSYDTVVKKHLGQLEVSSETRRTCFVVRLDLDFENLVS